MPQFSSAILYYMLDAQLLLQPPRASHREEWCDYAKRVTHTQSAVWNHATCKPGFSVLRVGITVVRVTVLELGLYHCEQQEHFELQLT